MGTLTDETAGRLAEQALHLQRAMQPALAAFADLGKALLTDIDKVLLVALAQQDQQRRRHRARRHRQVLRYHQLHPPWPDTYRFDAASFQAEAEMAAWEEMLHGRD